MPITSQLECSAAAAILALSDTTASNDGHRRRQRRQQIQQDGDGVAEGSGSGSGSGVIVAGEYGGNSACDANIWEYWCANRATPEACRTDSSIGALCSDDCCGIGVDYRPPFCCKTEPRSLAPLPTRAPHTRAYVSNPRPTATAYPASPLFWWILTRTRRPRWSHN